MGLFSISSCFRMWTAVHTAGYSVKHIKSICNARAIALGPKASVLRAFGSCLRLCISRVDHELNIVVDRYG